MGTHTVNLDSEAEAALKAIISHTKLGVPEAIKLSLLFYRQQIPIKTKIRPADFFENFNFGEGGDSLVSAREKRQRRRD